MRREDERAPAQQPADSVAEDVRCDVRVDGRQDVVEEDNGAARIGGAGERDARLYRVEGRRKAQDGSVR